MVIIKFSKEMYHKVALLKAAYSFTDRAYIHLDSDKHYYMVSIINKNKSREVNESEFVNEILAQTVRLEIQDRTKDIRKLVLARALSSTVIDEDSAEEPKYEDINISTIMRDWFENYE